MTEQMHHTPGPWRVVEKGQGWGDSWREIWAGNHAVVRADGYYSSKYDGYEFGVAISEPNARRIVACVNACDGIPTEALEAGVVRKLIEAATETALALLGRIEALEAMLLRLYQDTVVPNTHYCHRCGMIGGHDESCAMAEVEKLLGLVVASDGEAEGGATDGR